MNNPWIHLPTDAPFILPEDKPFIKRRQHNLVNNYRIHDEIYPQPFLGSPETAKIVVLALNPCFDPRNWDEQQELYFNQQVMNSLRHSSPFPFYLLDPQLSHTFGYEWWNRRFQHYISDIGREAVAQNFMAIDWFPYLSKRFHRVLYNERLPSQEYTFDLVRRAIQQKKEIIVMRSKRVWLESVPELKEYNYIELSCPQNPHLSKKQMTQTKYERVLMKLKA